MFSVLPDPLVAHPTNVNASDAVKTNNATHFSMIRRPPKVKLGRGKQNTACGALFI
jgi:hypothetical protein